MAAIQQVGRRTTSGTLEVYSWFFMRVSGVVLLLVAVFHLLWMHLVIGVDNINFDVVALRWQNPLWRVFDMSLLIFALTHGTNGTRWVLKDYIRSPGWQIAVKWFVYVVAVVVGAMGAYVIFSFQPPA
ncbi:MAG: succinate dehydrogenase [Chloroflexi bacterium]|nr:MAG: succinate dehydrogenase [Chloroflexota bacterium]